MRGPLSHSAVCQVGIGAGYVRNLPRGPSARAEEQTILASEQGIEEI